MAEFGRRAGLRKSDVLFCQIPFELFDNLLTLLIQPDVQISARMRRGDTMITHLAGFLAYIKQTRRITNDTHYWYGIRLSKVLPLAGKWTCSDDVLIWLYKQNHLKDSTKRGYFIALRLFYEWAETKGICENLCKGLEPRFDKPRHRIPPTQEQFWHALQAYPADKFWQQRNRAMFMFGFYTCARISEICNLQREHVFFDQGIVQFFGKRGKWRDVPMVPDLKDFLREWMARYPRQWIFPRTERADAPCSRGQISFCWRTYLREEKLPNWWFHDIRRAGATHLVRNGVSPFNVMGLLGHADFNTTKVYISHDLQGMLSEMTRAFSGQAQIKPCG